MSVIQIQPYTTHFPSCVLRHDTIIRVEHLVELEDGINNRFDVACKEVSNADFCFF